VRTIRDSLLLRLSADASQRLGVDHPQVVLGLHRGLTTHLLARPSHRRAAAKLLGPEGDDVVVDLAAYQAIAEGAGR
jgi:hypothetical protein